MFFPILPFLCSCYVIHRAYPILIDHLEDVTPNFSRLTNVKKHYVVKNLIKAVYLCVLSIIGLPLMVCAWYNYWPNAWIQSIAGLYCSNDIMGLYKVKELPTSTRLHHTVTFVFLLATFMTDFQHSSVGQMLFVYTYCSALCFPVNAYLGLRLCFEAEDVAGVKKMAKYVYSAMCIINWTLQYCMMHHTVHHMAYLGLLLFIVYDDIYLLRWLWKKSDV